MVMTLALLVYSIAQRRMRKALKAQGESIPNQMGQPTERPTLRWIFQLLEGINSAGVAVSNFPRVVLSVDGQVQVLIEGLTGTGSHRRTDRLKTKNSLSLWAKHLSNIPDFCCRISSLNGSSVRLLVLTCFCSSNPTGH